MKLPFKEYNANPKNRKTCDCVIRALTVATGMDYKDVYIELVDISLQTGYMLNEKRVEDMFMNRHGFIKVKQPRKNDNTKYTVNEIRLLTNAPIVVIRVAGHLTVVKDGVLIDTWNCGHKTINNYYVKLRR